MHEEDRCEIDKHRKKEKTDNGTFVQAGEHHEQKHRELLEGEHPTSGTTSARGKSRMRGLKIAGRPCIRFLVLTTSALEDRLPDNSSGVNNVR